MLRSIGAIVAGFLFIGALAGVTDAVVKRVFASSFDATGATGELWMLLLMSAYVAVFAITGCYLAARLAPNRPMRHALILGALGLVFNIIGSSIMWDTAPAWYHIMNLLLVMPYAWVGGRLRERQLESSGGSISPAAAS